MIKSFIGEQFKMKWDDRKEVFSREETATVSIVTIPTGAKVSNCFNCDKKGSGIITTIEIFFSLDHNLKNISKSMQRIVNCVMCYDCVLKLKKN